jgi:hypothetical protein
MSSSLFSSFQENTKCESSFFADTCMRRVPIFLIVFSEVALRAAKSVKRKRFNLFLEQDTTPPPPNFFNSNN